MNKLLLDIDFIHHYAFYFRCEAVENQEKMIP